jgi:hypothetical protein
MHMSISTVTQKPKTGGLQKPRTRFTLSLPGQASLHLSGTPLQICQIAMKYAVWLQTPTIKSPKLHGKVDDNANIRRMTGGLPKLGTRSEVRIGLKPGP